jgi:hypothetical protein
MSAGELAPLQALLCNAGAQFHGSISHSKDGFEETHHSAPLQTTSLVARLRKMAITCLFTLFYSVRESAKTFDEGQRKMRLIGAFTWFWLPPREPYAYKTKEIASFPQLYLEMYPK